MANTERITLEPVDSVEITTLIDNVNDLLLPGSEQVKRSTFDLGVYAEAPLMLEPRVSESLIGEHGFSALVTVRKGERSRTVMFDAGLTVGALAHNLDVMQLSIDDVEAIVMSHGHFDHVGGLHGLVRRFGGRRLPMLLHPEFWLRRRITVQGRDPFELPTASRSAMEGAGFDVIENEAPSLLLDDSVLITGEVARTTEFERGMPVHQAKRGDHWTPDPLILDDQALIVRVRDRGLVVLTGCGHSGIVNIVRHAQALTGEMRIHAVIGGFHLGGPLFEHAVRPTVEAMQKFAPTLVVPAHCTGVKAVHAIAAALPDAFVQNSVGTRYLL